MKRQTREWLFKLVPSSGNKNMALLAGPLVAFMLIFLYHPDIKHPEILGEPIGWVSC